MDALLDRLSGQAINLALKSGLAFTSSFAVQQCSRILKTVNDKAIHAELKALQKLFENKVKILSPSIDLIEFKSGRGNVFLESAVPLAKSLHREIIHLGKRLDDAATSEEAYRLAEARRKRVMSDNYRAELLLIIKDIKALIARIDRDIPLIHLAITNSGEKMNSAMSPGISPSRMMQASWLLNYADLQFAHNPNRPVQIGPSFTLSLYMLFLGHSKASGRAAQDSTTLPSPEPSEAASGTHEEPYGLGEGERKPIWQEVMHKARVRLCRTPLGWKFEQSRGYCPKTSPDPEVTDSYSATSAIAVLAKSEQYSYHLEIIEDLDDGRVHDEDGPKLAPLEGMPMAGIRESIPIHQISKIFYTNTGRLLNIRNTGEGDNSPILLLKRDVGARAPIGLREGWLNEPEDSQSRTTDDSDLEDHQFDVDRQLREESEFAKGTVERQEKAQAGHLPQHLDPEWLALEIFIDDDDDDDSEDSEDADSVSNGGTANRVETGPKKLGVPRNKSSIDSTLAAQLRRASSGPQSPEQTASRFSSGYFGETQIETSEAQPQTRRTPFSAGLTSLSLLEMMVRLTSLQEFQQTPHLSIPDHILTFFLDETSTTGAHDEAHWALRSEAKRRVGFDPYTDTPIK
ncbi:hypothetical protein OQA88_10200 [Cercophora sp. LCS_1]